MEELAKRSGTGTVLPDSIDVPKALTGGAYARIAQNQTRGVVEGLEQKQLARDNHPVRPIQWLARRVGRGPR